MQRLPLIIALFSLLSISTAQAQIVAPTPVCMDVQGGQVCMSFVASTPTETATLQPTATQTAMPTATATYTPTLSPTVTQIPTQTNIPFADFGGDLYRDAGTALVGTVSGATWAFPGAALTASTKNIFGNYMRGRQIVMAGWRLVWNPKTGPSPTGVRLVIFDDGPTNVTEIAQLSYTFYDAPLNQYVDITAAIRNILDNGQYKNIGQQTYGNGANGCLIYSSTLYVVWK